jgi:hypothetical protein
MRWLLPLLLASLIVFACSLGSAGARFPSAAAEAGSPVRVPLPVPRVHCGRPEALHLRRFEDGSAQLRCGRRLLARVAVPG